MKYFYEDADLEDDPLAKSRRDEWRRGSSPAQKASMLNAKATLRYIRENPGCTGGEIRAAGIRTNFRPLVEHGAAYWTKDGNRGLGMPVSEKARWYPKEP